MSSEPNGTVSHSLSASENGADVVEAPKQGQRGDSREIEPMNTGLDSRTQDVQSSAAPSVAAPPAERASSGSGHLPEASDSPCDVATVVLEARRRLYGQPQHDEATGRWVPANLGRGVGLANSEQFARLVEPARRERAARILGDHGETLDTATVTLADAADDLAKLELLSESFWQLVLERGATTSKGKTTAAVRQLLGVLDRKLAIYKLLGLERKAKPALSLADYLNGPADAEADAGQATHEPSAREQRVDSVPAAAGEGAPRED